MQVPLRLEILRRLSAALQEITPANGYQHDLSQQVYRGRDFFGESDGPGPFVSILEVPIQPDTAPPPVDGTVYRGPWELVVQGFTTDDKRNPTDPAHYLMADVKRKLTEIKTADRGKGALGPWGFPRGVSPVTGMQIGAGVVRPPDEVSYTAYFWLTLTLEVAEDLTAPFTY